MRKTREVMVGGVGVGGDNPVRIQSMTTSNTRDVEATIDQIVQLADHGCEIARLTVPGMKEAQACEGIKNGLIKRGYTIPLVADIHFYPPAAERAVDFVDKVRINPGNYVDKRATFKKIEYDDESYALELEKIREKFSPLVEKCKRLDRAMRIGVNHGSLSDRIMNRYGDTPEGMVESAFEFTRVARDLDYHKIVYSMKASNPLVMIQAYRLLLQRMEELEWDYPIHLGVTEAGDGQDGRVKSGVGIGSLLLDGIGDTIRVSLTEDPWCEIDPCKRLAKLAESRPIIHKMRPHLPIPSKRLPLHRDGSVLLEEPAEGIDFCVEGALSLDQLGLHRFAHQTTPLIVRITGDEKSWEPLLEVGPDLLLISPGSDRVEKVRRFFDWMRGVGLRVPLILNFAYDCSEEDLVICASAECGALLCDGIGDGLCLKGPYPPERLRFLSFNILQASRRRATRTEFIACPSCGRTLFDLQEVTAQIRARTAHLPGVKIAIMGCIVNGPGEMADADFGYVGSLPGKIDLYVGKERVERSIDQSEACERLIDLIKRHDRWTDPVSSV